MKVVVIGALAALAVVGSVWAHPGPEPHSKAPERSQLETLCLAKGESAEHCACGQKLAMEAMTEEERDAAYLLMAKKAPAKRVAGAVGLSLDAFMRKIIAWGETVEAQCR